MFPWRCRLVVVSAVCFCDECAAYRGFPKTRLRKSEDLLDIRDECEALRCPLDQTE